MNYQKLCEQKYLDERLEVLKLKPEDLDLKASDDLACLSATIDFSTDNGILTLFMAINGVVCYLYSNGNGEYGLGKNNLICDKAMALLLSSAVCLDEMEITNDFSLPKYNGITVYLTTAKGSHKVYLNPLKNKNYSDKMKYLDYLVNDLVGFINSEKKKIS